VEQQISNCKVLAEQEKLEVCGTFSDLNTSGKTYPEGAEFIGRLDQAFQNWIKSSSLKKFYRPGLAETLKKLPEVDFILVDDYTRFARPISGGFLESYLSQLLISASVKIWAVKGGVIDHSNFSDNLITSLQNQINDNQIKIQRKKSKDALRNLKDSGEYYAGLGKTFGFKHDGKNFVPDEEEAEVVRFIFEEYSKYVPIFKIMREVNDKYKHLFKSDYGISRRVFKNILRRVLYTGYQYNSSGELIENINLIKNPIIPFSLWEKVQQIMDQNSLIRPKAKKGWLPLSGLVFCGYCGHRMTISCRNSTQKYYECITRSIVNDGECRTNQISSTGEGKSWGMGLVEFLKPFIVGGLLKQLEESRKVEENRTKSEQLKVELKNLETKEKDLTDLFSEGLLDKNIFRKKLVGIKDEKSRINRELIKFSTRPLLTEDRIAQEIKSVISMMSMTLDELKNTSFESLLRSTVKKIIVFIDHLEIETVYGKVSIKRNLVSNHNTMPHYVFGLVYGKNSEVKSYNVTIYYGKNYYITKHKDLNWYKTVMNKKRWTKLYSFDKFNIFQFNNL